MQSKSTRVITPKRVTVTNGGAHLRGLGIVAPKKRRSGGEPLATICLILPARNWNLKPAAPRAISKAPVSPSNMIGKVEDRRHFLCLRAFFTD